MEITVMPVGTGSTSMSSYVAACIRELDTRGASYQLTPMGTIIEGETDELLTIARQLHEIPFGADVSRVVTIIRIDDRRDRRSSIQGKVKSVADRLP